MMAGSCGCGGFLKRINHILQFDGISFVDLTDSMVPLVTQGLRKCGKRKGKLVKLPRDDDELTLDLIPFHQERLVSTDSEFANKRPSVVEEFSITKAATKPSSTRRIAFESYS